MEMNNYSSSSSSSDSDDEDVINFVVNLGRIRKIPRFHIRKGHFHHWDDQEFYNRYRLSKESVVILLEQIDGKIRNATNW
jgi:hypothetical protein